METGGIYSGRLFVGAIVIKSLAVLWLAPLLRYPEEHYGLVVGKKNLAPTLHPSSPMVILFRGSVPHFPIHESCKP